MPGPLLSPMPTPLRDGSSPDRGVSTDDQASDADPPLGRGAAGATPSDPPNPPPRLSSAGVASMRCPGIAKGSAHRRLPVAIQPLTSSSETCSGDDHCALR